MYAEEEYFETFFTAERSTQGAMDGLHLPAAPMQDVPRHCLFIDLIYLLKVTRDMITQFSPHSIGKWGDIVDIAV